MCRGRLRPLLSLGDQVAAAGAGQAWAGDKKGVSEENAAWGLDTSRVIWGAGDIHTPRELECSTRLITIPLSVHKT